jgi:hypothetical protein
VFYCLGRKGRAASSYPRPEYPIVIEPFAGSMGYTLRHRPAYAIGIERDSQTYELWHRLTSMTAAEIRDFPSPVVGKRSYDRWVIQAARTDFSGVRYRTVTPFMAAKFEAQRRMALRHHAYARRSVIYRHGDYTEAPDIEATWFIDPPYVGVTNGYVHGPGDIDYDELAQWCLSRRGQVIICEGPDAEWLPFRHLRSWPGQPHHGQRSVPTVEHVLVHRTHRRCEECSTTFPASRSDARYCSARCRQRASRRRRARRSSPSVRR